MSGSKLVRVPSDFEAEHLRRTAEFIDMGDAACRMLGQLIGALTKMVDTVEESGRETPPDIKESLDFLNQMREAVEDFASGAEAQSDLRRWADGWEDVK